MKRRLILSLAAILVGSPARAQTRAISSPTNVIDINNASRDELMTLDGIGEVRADSIIRNRPFKVKGDLVERRIIPEALYDRIADKLVARTAPAPSAAKPPATPQRR